ncbi:MAG: hypothetical protein ABEJ94_11440 [Halorientalis sp.]
MDRRRFLRHGAVGVTLGTVGCLGIGGEVVVRVQRTVSVEPGSGWIKEIPDVSDNGGTISYISRAQAPFDVYFFTSQRQMRQYDAYVGGDAPRNHPAGDRAIGGTATVTDAGNYAATTTENGGRQPIDETGPYYFVLDHSDYPAAGGARPREIARPRSIYLDLTVTRKRFGF